VALIRRIKEKSGRKRNEWDEERRRRVNNIGFPLPKAMSTMKEELEWKLSAQAKPHQLRSLTSKQEWMEKGKFFFHCFLLLFLLRILIQFWLKKEM